jgi:hypothetical protein
LVLTELARLSAAAAGFAGAEPAGLGAGLEDAGVEMLRRVYAGRAEGLEDLWITRMTQTLPQDQP